MSAAREITKERLKGWDACADGYRWFLTKFPSGSADLLAVHEALNADKRYDDAVWLMDRFFSTLEGSKPLREKRSWLAIDWILRVHTPAWLALSPATAEHAAQLRALAPITSEPELAKAQVALDAARRAAAAAWAAAWDAAWAAARDAAWDAARDAAWAAAWAAAWDAARDAARDAAQKAKAEGKNEYDAARAAADAYFAQTVAELQPSAQDLFLRMINAQLEDAATLDRADEVQS